MATDPSHRQCSQGSPAPLFLLGQHRGGTTYVQRLLNCQRRVVVWGENGGLVTHLRRAHDRARNLAPATASSYQEFDAFAARFSPWVSRVDQAGLREAMAAFVRDLHRAEAPAAYWGFKEIRHGNARDLRFLRALFPDARLVLVVRHPHAVLRSELHAAWTPRLRKDHVASRARRFVKRYLRVVAAFLQAAAENPKLTHAVTYEALLDARGVERLFTWLDVELEVDDVRRLAEVRAALVGSSFWDAGRAVDPALVQRAMTALDEELRAALPALDSHTRAGLLRWYPDLEPRSC